MDKRAFIGGFRSGTTLLVNLLGLHPAVAPWFETKDLSEALRWMRVLREPGLAAFEAGYVVPRHLPGFSPAAVLSRMQYGMDGTFARLEGSEASGKGGHERYPLGHDRIGYTQAQGRAALENWYAAVAWDADFETVAAATGRLISGLGELHRCKLGSPVWINKTPEIPRFAAELRAALGGCRIVYLVRNGLDVVNSAASLGWGEVEQLAWNWKGLLELTRAAMASHPEDYLELRYEDLLAEPAAVLDRTLAFCGLPREGEAIVARFTREFGAGAFDRSRIGASARLSAEERAAFDRVAGELQSALGY